MAHIQRRRATTGEWRYDVRWRAGDAERSKSFARRKDADAYKAKVEGDELVGIVADPRPGKVTFASYAAGWLDSRVVNGRPLSPSTRYGYERLLDRNILPHLGSMPLRAITPEQVRTWYGTVTAASGHDQTAKSYRLLSAILNTAVSDERIARNPCRIRGGGREKAPERPMPTTAEVLALVEAMPARYRLVLVLAGMGGLRMGEILGLRLSDVDPLREAVHIRQAALEIPGMGRVVKSPKSAAGRRTVVLPKQAIEAISAHLEAFGCADSGELITDPKGGPAPRSRISDAWTEAKATVGVDPEMHPHDLRHHAATLMAQMPGITTKELMARIGHSSPGRPSSTNTRRPSGIARWRPSWRRRSTQRHPSSPGWWLSRTPETAPRNKRAAGFSRDGEPGSDTIDQHKQHLTCGDVGRRRPESNRCTGLCRLCTLPRTPWSKPTLSSSGSGQGASGERTRGK